MDARLDMMMERVSSLMDERGMTQSEFARLMGVSRSCVAMWKKRGLPADRVPRAADVLSVSADAILGRCVDAPDGSVRVVLSGSIPVLGKAKLGDDGYFADIDDVHGFGRVMLPSRDPNAYALLCVGDSMEPRIRSGEFVVAEPGREAKPGDEVVVQDTDGRSMVKRLLYTRDGVVHLQSINAAHSIIKVPAEKVRGIHPVLAIVSRALVSED